MAPSTDQIQSRLATDLSSLLKSEQYSDFVITCGNDRYNVHKAIICTRSGFLAGNMRFSLGKEVQDGVLDLPEDDPDTVRLMINYIYTGAYESGFFYDQWGRNTDVYYYNFPHSCEPYGCQAAEVCPHHICYDHNRRRACKDFICRDCCKDHTPADLMTHAQLYSVADKYDISGLAAISRKRFIEAAALFWDSTEFKKAARYVYEATPDYDTGLVSVVARTIAAHMELIDEDDIEALMRDFNGLAFGILKRKSKELGWSKK